jgi:hypothetical protein
VGGPVILDLKGFTITNPAGVNAGGIAIDAVRYPAKIISSRSSFSKKGDISRQRWEQPRAEERPRSKAQNSIARGARFQSLVEYSD